MATPFPRSEALPHEGASDLARTSITPPEPDLAQRVLIVDDNRDAAESLAMLIEVLGCEAEVCFDGMAALAAVDRFRPDLVLLDLTMPGMSGFEVARALRAQGARTRVLALSGRGDDECRQQADDAGFDGHLLKPVDVATLQATLRATPPS